MLYSPTLGDQAPYAGVAPVFQGVMAGDMPLMGLGAEPKNIPVASIEKENVRCFTREPGKHRVSMKI